MGIGVISLQTSQKKEQSGPPFVAGSANNGLSVDSITGKIVLGNDDSDLTAPARLISNRDIDMENAGMSFRIALNSVLTGIKTLLSGDSLVISGGNFTGPFLRVDTGDFGTSEIRSTCGDGGSSTIEARTGSLGFPTFRLNNNFQDILDITAGNNVATFVVGLSTTIIAIHTGFFSTQITGGIGRAFNHAALQINGPTTKYLFDDNQGPGNYAIDRNIDSSKVFTNTGALVLDLPNMVGSNFRSGFYIEANIIDVAGITIDADAGVTIRYGGLSTSAGGTIFSTEVGAYIRVKLVDSTTWAVCFSVGLWNLT